MFIKDFILFRRMLTPLLIQFLFWAGLIACFVIGIIWFIHKHWLHGIEIILLGPIAVRITSELLILFFRINETLTNIEYELKKKS